MRILTTIFLFLFAIAGHSQTNRAPVIFTRQGDSISNSSFGGYVAVIGQFKIPTDTILVRRKCTRCDTGANSAKYNDTGSIAWVNGYFLVYDGANWSGISGGGGSGDVTLLQLNDSLGKYIARRDSIGSGKKYVTPYKFDSVYTYLIGVDEYLDDRLDSTINVADSSTAYVTHKRLKTVADSVAGLIPVVTGFATTVALADSVSGRVKYTDTVGMSNRINLSMRYTDTAGLSNRIDLRVKYTDTVGMSNRIDLRMRYTDTAGLSNRIDLRVKYTDTVGMSNRIDLRVKYTDTVGMSNRIDLRVKYTDTVGMSNRIDAKGTGSVTSVAIANAFGLNWSGTPITGTGTFTPTIDTSKIASVASVNGKQSTSLTSGYLWVGSTSNLATGTPLSGDATIGSTGSMTLAASGVTATSYGSSTAIPTFTVDAKGRLTAASTAAVVAPAGTLTGSSLPAGVTGSSLTSHGTVTSGGLGTGAVIGGVTMTLGSDASYDIYYRGSSGVLTRLPAGVDGYVLTTHSVTSAPAWAPASSGSATIVYAGDGLGVTGTASVNPTVAIVAPTVYTCTVTSNATTVTATNSHLQTVNLTAGSTTDTISFSGFTTTAAGGCGKINQVVVTCNQGATPNTGGVYLKGTNFAIMANSGRMPFTGTTASTTGLVLYLWYDPQSGNILVDYGSDYRKP